MFAFNSNAGLLIKTKNTLKSEFIYSWNIFKYLQIIFPCKKNPHGKTASRWGGIKFTFFVCQGLLIVSIFTSPHPLCLLLYLWDVSQSFQTRWSHTCLLQRKHLNCLQCFFFAASCLSLWILSVIPISASQQAFHVATLISFSLRHNKSFFKCFCDKSSFFVPTVFQVLWGLIFFLLGLPQFVKN